MLMLAALLVCGYANDLPSMLASCANADALLLSCADALLLVPYAALLPVCDDGDVSCTNPDALVTSFVNAALMPCCLQSQPSQPSSPFSILFWD